MGDESVRINLTLSAHAHTHVLVCVHVCDPISFAHPLSVTLKTVDGRNIASEVNSWPSYVYALHLHARPSTPTSMLIRGCSGDPSSDELILPVHNIEVGVRGVLDRSRQNFVMCSHQRICFPTGKINSINRLLDVFS